MTLAAENIALKAEVARLRKALEFYASSSAFDYPKGVRGLSQESYSYFDSPIYKDQGNTAKESLSISPPDPSPWIMAAMAAIDNSPQLGHVHKVSDPTVLNMDGWQAIAKATGNLPPDEVTAVREVYCK